MIKFYTVPVPEEMKVYNGETHGNAWNDEGYKDGVPADWWKNNTEAYIKKILQAKASQYAFTDKSAQTSFILAVQDTATEAVMVVLKGVHQYKAAKLGAPASAHITVAWFTHLYHLNVKELGTGTNPIGVANLGVNSATEGAKSVSSDATGWSTVDKGKR